MRWMRNGGKAMIITTDLTVVRCWCGIQYSIPSSLYMIAKESGQTVFCPMGHQWVFKGFSANAQLQNERDDLRLQLQQRDNQLADERREKARLINRAKRGVCIYCQRFFPNVLLHMRCKHPKAREA